MCIRSETFADESGIKFAARGIDAEPVTVSALSAGEKKPDCRIEGNALIVSHALACRVLHSDGAGGYAAHETLQPAGGENRYALSSLDDGAELAVVVVGDVNGNDTVNSLNAAMIYACNSGRLKSLPAALIFCRRC